MKKNWFRVGNDTSFPRLNDAGDFVLARGCVMPYRRFLGVAVDDEEEAAFVVFNDRMAAYGIRVKDPGRYADELVRLFESRRPQ